MTHMFLAVLDRNVNQLSILGLFRRSENQRWIRGGILWLVFGNCFQLSVLDKVTGQNLTHWQSLQSRKRRPVGVLAMLHVRELWVRTVPVDLSCSNEFDMIAVLVKGVVLIVKDLLV